MAKFLCDGRTVWTRDSPDPQTRLPTRVDFGNKDDAQDVFFKGDVLYKLEGGNVWTINARGVRMKIVCTDSYINTKYCPNIAWWHRKLRFGKNVHTWENVAIPLKLKRKRDDHLS